MAVIIFSCCNQDVKNVLVEGHVLNKKNMEPVPNLRLYLLNYYYEGGDYDSYMGPEVHIIYTDSNGYFFINLDKSAYIQIDTSAKETSEIYRDYYVNKKNISIDLSY